MTDYTEEGIEAKAEKKEEKKEVKKIEEETGEKMVELQKKLSEMEEKEKEEHSDTTRKASRIKKELKDKSYYTYKLIGVVVHNGNAEAGHYYSYINVARHEWETNDKYLRTENDRWLEFNDSTISEFAFSKLESECFGGAQEDISAGVYAEDYNEVAKLIGGRSKSAYMLIYERQKKDPIPLKIADYQPISTDLVLSSLECDSTAVSRAEKEGFRLIGKDGAEFYSFHRFHGVPVSIPSDLVAVQREF